MSQMCPPAIDVVVGALAIGLLLGWCLGYAIFGRRP